ncbi:MAG: acyl carrier protein [Cyclobacteriaceae bacterium]
MTKAEIVKRFREIIASELRIDEREIRDDELFLSIGLDSVSCIVVLEQLEKEIGRELSPVLFWDHPTIDQFAQYLADEQG